MLRQSKARASCRRLKADLDLIDGGFTDYLRQRHAADFTIALYCRFLRRVARYLAQGTRRALMLRRRDVPQIMRGCLPGWKAVSRRSRRSGLLQWLRFLGRFREPVPRVRWQEWLDAYDHFLRVDHQRLPEVLDEDQRRKLLAAFDRRSKQGRRDFTIAICLIDLGLRAVEVSRLRVDDINWRLRCMTVPAAKASRGRQLPLPPRVATALRSYLRHRPHTDVNRLFVGQAKLRGRPLSSWAIASTMDRAYRRCGFHGWYGTHRLRHSFATRLHARGATTKEIADLLGHRRVATTDHYTQAGDLQPLTQPWPISPRLRS